MVLKIGTQFVVNQPHLINSLFVAKSLYFQSEQHAPQLSNMNFKFVIVLLAFVAASQAMYFVVNTWADEYCNTTLIGKYWVSKSSITNASILIRLFILQTNYEGYCIKKRFVSQDTGDCRTSPVLGDGVHYSYDSSYCTSDAEPEVPGDWHVVKLGEHCNYQANDSFYGVVAGKRNLLRNYIF
jgi:hypothetical protein